MNEWFLKYLIFVRICFWYIILGGKRISWFVGFCSIKKLRVYCYYMFFKLVIYFLKIMFYICNKFDGSFILFVIERS